MSDQRTRLSAALELLIELLPDERRATVRSAFAECYQTDPFEEGRGVLFVDAEVTSWWCRSLGFLDPSTRQAVITAAVQECESDEAREALLQEISAMDSEVKPATVTASIYALYRGSPSYVILAGMAVLYLLYRAADSLGRAIGALLS